MSNTPQTNRSSSPEEAVLEDEIQGTVIPGFNANGLRNAFSILMSSGPRPGMAPRESPNGFVGRDGLGAYTHNPSAFPSSRVIYYDNDVVAINDLFPKSSVHTLLLPRSPRNLLHPFDAFEDPDFLALVQRETQKLKTLVAKELQRRYGRFSAMEATRQAALNGDLDVAELPPGRDWEKDVKTGIHAGPSMNHLHVHVLSVDHFSPSLRHRKHYNSFNTPFLVDVDAFPLAPDDPRRHPGRGGYLNYDLICWRCRRNFGNRFTAFKSHLADEFEEWKKV